VTSTNVTAEIRGDEIFVWFMDGPAYSMQHDHIHSKPYGWESLLTPKNGKLASVNPTSAGKQIL
jgi:hypothetical protein